MDRHEISSGIATTVTQFLHDLNKKSRTKPFDPNAETYELPIDGEVTAEELKGLLRLPCEVSLIEMNGRLILATGKPEYVQMKNRKYRVHLHTHQIHESLPAADAPSLQDAMMIPGGYSASLLLAHPSGMTLFQLPIFHPLTGRAITVNEDNRDIVIRFLKAKGIDLYDFDTGLRHYNDLPENELVALNREFAESSGMILQAARWGEDAIRELMNIVNLQVESKTIDVIRKGRRACIERDLFRRMVGEGGVEPPTAGL